MTTPATPPTEPNVGPPVDTLPDDEWWFAFGLDEDPADGDEPDLARVAAVRRRPNLPGNASLREKGLWNDPGSGRFIRIGLSTRGAASSIAGDDRSEIIAAARTVDGPVRFRLADNMLRTVAGVGKGDYVEGVYLDDDTVELSAPNGRDYQVKWARVDEIQVPDPEPEVEVEVEAPEMQRPLAQFLAQALNSDNLADQVQRTAWAVATRGGTEDEVLDAIAPDTAEVWQDRHGDPSELARILLHNVAVQRRAANGPPLSRDNLGAYGLPTAAEVREHDPELAEALGIGLPDTGTDERGLSGAKALEAFGRRGISEALNGSEPDPVVVRFLQMHRRAALAELAGRDTVTMMRGVAKDSPAGKADDPYMTGVRNSPGSGVTSWTSSTGVPGIYGDKVFSEKVPVDQILAWDSIGNMASVQNEWDYNGHNTVPLRGIEVLVVDDPEALDRLMANDPPFRRVEEPTPEPPPEVTEALEAIRGGRARRLNAALIRDMARWHHQNNPGVLARVDDARPTVELVQRWDDGRTSVRIGLRDDEGWIFAGADPDLTDEMREVGVRGQLVGRWGGKGVKVRSGLVGVPGYESETLYDTVVNHVEWEEHPNVPQELDVDALRESLDEQIGQSKVGGIWQITTGPLERIVDGDNGWIDYQQVTAKVGTEDPRTGEWRDVTITARMPVGFRKTTEYDLMFGPLAGPTIDMDWTIDGPGGIYEPEGRSRRIFAGEDDPAALAIAAFVDQAESTVIEARGAEAIPEGVFYVDDSRGPNNKYDWSQELERGPELSPEDQEAVLRYRARVTKFGSLLGAVGSATSEQMAELLQVVKDWDPEPGMPEWPQDRKARWSGAIMGRGYLSANLKALRQNPELADPDAVRVMQLMRQDFLDKTPSPVEQIRLYRGADAPGEGNAPSRYGIGRTAEKASSGVTSWSAPELNKGEWGTNLMVEDVPFDRVLGRFGTVLGEILVADDPAIIEAIDNYEVAPANVWAPKGPDVRRIAMLGQPPALSDEDRQALRAVLGKAAVYHSALGEELNPEPTADGTSPDKPGKDEARLAAWDRMRAATSEQLDEATRRMTRYATDDAALWNNVLIQRQLLAAAFLAPDGAEDPDVTRTVQLLHGHLADAFPDGKDALQLRRASATGDGAANTDDMGKPSTSGLTSWTANPADNIGHFGDEVTEAVPLDRIVGRFGAMEHEVIVVDDPAKLRRLLDYTPPSSGVRARALLADVGPMAFTSPYALDVPEAEREKLLAQIDSIVDGIVGDGPALPGAQVGTDAERVVALFPTAPQSDPTLLDVPWADVRSIVADTLLFSVEDDWEPGRVATRVREAVTRTLGDPSTGPLAPSGLAREADSLAAMHRAAQAVERLDPTERVTPEDRKQLDVVVAAGTVLLDDLRSALAAVTPDQPEVTPELLDEAREAEVLARRDAAAAVQKMKREPVLAAALKQLADAGVTGVGVAPVGTEMTWKNTDRRTRLTEGAQFFFTDEADIEWVLEPVRTQTKPSKVKGWKLRTVGSVARFDEGGVAIPPPDEALYLVTSGPGVAATKKAAVEAEPVVMAWFDAQDYTKSIESMLGMSRVEANATLRTRFWDDVWPNLIPPPAELPAVQFSQFGTSSRRTPPKERLARFRERQLYQAAIQRLNGDPFVLDDGPYRAGAGRARWKLPRPPGPAYMNPWTDLELEMAHSGEAWVHATYTFDDGRSEKVTVQLAERRVESMDRREPAYKAMSRLRAERLLDTRHRAAVESDTRQVLVEWAKKNLGAGAAPALTTEPRTAAQKARVRELNDKVSSFLPAAIVEALPPVDSTAISSRRSKYRPSEALLMFGTGARESTYLHEYGHHVEHNRPLLARAAWAFYRARTDNEEPTHLGPGYESWEFTREDRFYNRYAGKLYGLMRRPGVDEGQASEVFTMGLEGLFLGSTGKDGETIDDEYAAFILGALVLDAERGVTAGASDGPDTELADDGGKAIERSRRIALAARDAGYEARPVGVTLRIAGPGGRRFWRKTGPDQWTLVGESPAVTVSSQELRDWKAGDLSLDAIRASG